MITLITGTPGAGKTLYTVAEELKKFGDRPLFVDGIPDLALPHLTFPPEGLDEWQSWAPDGAVIVVDEAQRSWRPRPAGSRPPDCIAALETHRHKGVDILLITQHPNLIDQNVRRLVGRHVHVRRVFGWGRAILYEWDQATDPTRVRTAITRSWAYPKKAYKLYKSATVHTARGQRAPWVLWAAVLAAVALPIVGYYVYDRLHHRFKPDPQSAAVTAPSAPAPVPAQVPPHDLPPGPAAATVARPDAFIPTVYGRPETAPAYAEVVKVVTFPQVTACLSSRSKCGCYSQQGTRIDMTEDLCRKYAKEGVPFNPFREDRETPPPKNQTPPSPIADAASPPSREGGGNPTGDAS